MTLTNKSIRSSHQRKVLVLLGMAFGLLLLNNSAKAQYLHPELVHVGSNSGNTPTWWHQNYTMGTYYGHGNDNGFVGLWNRTSSTNNTNDYDFLIYWGDDTTDDLLFMNQQNGEMMQLGGDGLLSIGSSTFNESNTYKLGVDGTGYFEGGVIFSNSEGTDFGTWGTSSYDTEPTAATLMYDANWDNESADPEYNTNTYFVGGQGADEDIGGLSFWGGNATAEWEHMLTTYNMRYLKGDMYSLDLEESLTVSNISNSGNDLTVTGGLVSQNATTTTNFIQMGHGGLNAYLLYEGVGNLDFRNGTTTYVQMAADGKFGVGGDFNPAYALEVRGDGYFQNAVTLNSVLTVAGATTIGTAGTDANLTVYGQAKVKELYIDPTNIWADYVFARDYELRSLAEVKTFIEDHGHLPGVKSAEEVATEGYAQTEVNAMLLSKVEELTLYMIDLEAQNAELKQSNEELRAMVQALINLQDQK